MKNLFKKTAVTLSIFGVLFSAGILVSPALAQAKFADEKNDWRWQCSARTIRGSYSYTAQGVVLAGSPLPVPVGPFVSIGTVKLDGGGNITEHITNDNFNGTILPAINYTGTYSVNDDCSGTANLVGRAPYKFVIADGGNEIYFMLDAPGTVVTGTAKRH